MLMSTEQRMYASSAAALDASADSDGGDGPSSARSAASVSAESDSAASASSFDGMNGRAHGRDRLLSGDDGDGDGGVDGDDDAAMDAEVARVVGSRDDITNARVLSRHAVPMSSLEWNDPELAVDLLPQPFRMLDQILHEDILERAWDTITQRQRSLKVEARVHDLAVTHASGVIKLPLTVTDPVSDMFLAPNGLFLCMVAGKSHLVLVDAETYRLDAVLDFRSQLVSSQQQQKTAATNDPTAHNKPLSASSKRSKSRRVVMSSASDAKPKVDSPRDQDAGGDGADTSPRADPTSVSVSMTGLHDEEEYLVMVRVDDTVLLYRFSSLSRPGDLRFVTSHRLQSPPVVDARVVAAQLSKDAVFVAVSWSSGHVTLLVLPSWVATQPIESADGAAAGAGGADGNTLGMPMPGGLGASGGGLGLHRRGGSASLSPKVGSPRGAMSPKLHGRTGSSSAFTFGQPADGVAAGGNTDHAAIEELSPPIAPPSSRAANQHPSVHFTYHFHERQIGEPARLGVRHLLISWPGHSQVCAYHAPQGAHLWAVDGWYDALSAARGQQSASSRGAESGSTLAAPGMQPASSSGKRLGHQRTGSSMKAGRSHRRGKSVAVSSDEEIKRLLAFHEERKQRLLRCDLTRPVAQWLMPAAVTRLQVDQSGTMLGVGLEDGSLVALDTRTGMAVQHFLKHRGAVSALCFSADRRQLVSAGRDGRCHMYRITNSLGRDQHSKPNAGGAAAIKPVNPLVRKINSFSILGQSRQDGHDADNEALDVSQYDPNLLRSARRREQRQKAQALDESFIGRSDSFQTPVDSIHFIAGLPLAVCVSASASASGSASASASASASVSVSASASSGAADEDDAKTGDDPRLDEMRAGVHIFDSANNVLLARLLPPRSSSHSDDDDSRAAKAEQYLWNTHTMKCTDTAVWVAGSRVRLSADGQVTSVARCVMFERASDILCAVYPRLGDVVGLAIDREDQIRRLFLSVPDHDDRVLPDAFAPKHRVVANGPRPGTGAGAGGAPVITLFASLGGAAGGGDGQPQATAPGFTGRLTPHAPPSALRTGRSVATARSRASHVSFSVRGGAAGAAGGGGGGGGGRPMTGGGGSGLNADALAQHDGFVPGAADGMEPMEDITTLFNDLSRHVFQQLLAREQTKAARMRRMQAREDEIRASLSSS